MVSSTVCSLKQAARVKQAKVRPYNERCVESTLERQNLSKVGYDFGLEGPLRSLCVQVVFLFAARIDYGFCMILRKEWENN